MIKLRDAKVDDFDKIYPLLNQINSSRANKEMWRQLFINHFDTEEDYFGYVMTDSGTVVGFQGLIFSRRLINSKWHKFCNLTSWVVQNEYRSKSLLLLFKTLKLKDYTLTCFSSGEEVSSVLQKFGFKPLQVHLMLIPFFPVIKSVFSRYSIIINDSKIKNQLDKYEQKIYRDHLNSNCIHLLIKREDQRCYLVLTKTLRKRLPFALIHYIGNLRLFKESINTINIYICWKLKVLGLLSDFHELKGDNIRYTIMIKRPCPTLFKSSTLERNDVDTLYSEYTILGV